MSDHSYLSKERKCCAWCGKPISGPLWKRWCSDSCKMRAYRSRRKRRNQEQEPEPVTANRNDDWRTK